MLVLAIAHSLLLRISLLPSPVPQGGPCGCHGGQSPLPAPQHMYPRRSGGQSCKLNDVREATLATRRLAGALASLATRLTEGEEKARRSGQIWPLLARGQDDGTEVSLSLRRARASVCASASVAVHTYMGRYGCRRSAFDNPSAEYGAARNYWDQRSGASQVTIKATRTVRGVPTQTKSVNWYPQGP
jgi:hypothetical protein